MSCVDLQQTGSFYFIEPKNDNNNKKGGLLKKLLLVAVLLMAALVGFSQRPETYCLKVKIWPTVDGQAVKGASIKLYRDGAEEMIIDTTNKRFAILYLQRDASYTLEVSAPGRLPRKVSIDTRVPDEMPDGETFKCVMEVEMPSAFGLVNEYYESFPVAMVKFDEERVNFGHIKDYTETVRTRMEEEPQGDIVATPESTPGTETDKPVAATEQ
jgi:hypothetical protein